MAGQVNIGGTTASVQLTGNDSITADQEIGFPDTNGASAVVVVTPTSQDIDTTGSISTDGTISAGDYPTSGARISPAGVIIAKRVGGDQQVAIGVNNADNGEDQTFKVLADGGVYIGGDLTQTSGNPPANANITMRASDGLILTGRFTSTQTYAALKGGDASAIPLQARRTTTGGSDFVAAFYGGTTGATYVKVGCDGSLQATGPVTGSNTSDIRFKENITDANPQLADVVALGSQLKNFDWKDDVPLNDELKAKRFLGLIAQEAEKVCPQLTYTVERKKDGQELTAEVTDADGNVTAEATYEQLDDSYKAINHDILVMKLLGAVAELKAEIDQLKGGSN